MLNRRRYRILRYSPFNPTEPDGLSNSTTPSTSSSPSHRSQENQQSTTHRRKHTSPRNSGEETAALEGRGLCGSHIAHAHWTQAVPQGALRFTTRLHDRTTGNSSTTAARSTKEVRHDVR